MDDKKNPQSEIRKSSISKLDGGTVLMPEFFDGIAKIVEQARIHIERSVNMAMYVTMPPNTACICRTRRCCSVSWQSGLRSSRKRTEVLQNEIPV